MLDDACVLTSDRAHVEASDLKCGVDLDSGVRDVELAASGRKDCDTRGSDELLINVIGVFVGGQDNVGTVDTTPFTPNPWVNDERLPVRLEAHTRV